MIVVNGIEETILLLRHCYDLKIIFFGKGRLQFSFSRLYLGTRRFWMGENLKENEFSIMIYATSHLLQLLNKA